ncbi:AraC family transcriptional regulator [Nocardia zapadnayensis]|uniref:helix-turn-helix transcriptional regulator n=1 Tax=Nocardia rhamnosiphila TaxID=426716 RepID=UPI0022472EFF|nr:AraC family transcriptional regulator [Nocardia zapadnayensis]MCX0275274.1 AraC family transcriptional regulator [Nocardia zapadnayensis]
MLADLPEVIHLPAPETRHTPVGAIVDLLDGELTADRPGHDAMLRSLLDALLLHILRRWLDRRADTGWSAALHDPAVAAALSAIHGSPGHGWTVAELAAHAGVSRAGFARRFTELIGRPPIAYLTWWRMTLAARQLRDTDTPLTLIARDAGYASEFAFAHAFKNDPRVNIERSTGSGPSRASPVDSGRGSPAAGRRAAAAGSRAARSSRSCRRGSPTRHG